MLSYRELKVKLQSQKQTLIFVGGAMLIFLLGFGTGQGFSPRPNKSGTSNANYAIKTADPPISNFQDDGAAANKTKSNKTSLPKPKPGQPCLIKGNISGSSKIYHVKGGSFYERVTPEACFNTEAEAKAAGFRKSGR